MKDSAQDLDACYQKQKIVRLTAGDREAARKLFELMADVFGEQHSTLNDDYVDGLLHQTGFWAFAAFVADTIVGGLTAHTIPMTTGEFAEIFIYDIAVTQHYRRRGIGSRLVAAIRHAAAVAGIRQVFVQAETADAHALDFYRALGGKAFNAVVFSFESTASSG